MPMTLLVPTSKHLVHCYIIIARRQHYAHQRYLPALLTAIYITEPVLQFKHGYTWLLRPHAILPAHTWGLEIKQVKKMWGLIYQDIPCACSTFISRYNSLYKFTHGQPPLGLSAKINMCAFESKEHYTEGRFDTLPMSSFNRETTCRGLLKPAKQISLPQVKLICSVSL